MKYAVIAGINETLCYISIDKSVPLPSDTDITTTIGHMTIKLRLTDVYKQIREAEASCGRLPNSVQLIAVSKTCSAQSIADAYAAGQQAFGENYVQEAVAKINELASLPIEWHFIGPIQSNKCKAIAEHFTWVHSVSSEKVARRLNQYRANGQGPLSVCLQVNIDAEATKSGIDEGQVFDLAECIHSLPKLRLRGLMAIPKATDSNEEQRKSFHRMQELFAALQQHYSYIDTLSMGMSNDFPLAIAEGATMVRIGSAIFGRREKTGEV